MPKLIRKLQRAKKERKIAERLFFVNTTIKDICNWNHYLNNEMSNLLHAKIDEEVRQLPVKFDRFTNLKKSVREKSNVAFVSKIHKTVNEDRIIRNKQQLDEEINVDDIVSMGEALGNLLNKKK